MGILNTLGKVPIEVFEWGKDVVNNVMTSWGRTGTQALSHSLRNNVVDAGSAVVHSLNPAKVNGAANLLVRAGARTASIGINITAGIVKIGAPIFAVVGLIAAYKAIKHYAAGRKEAGGIPDEQFAELRNQALEQSYIKGKAAALAEESLTPGGLQNYGANINYRADHVQRHRPNGKEAPVPASAPAVSMQDAVAARQAAASTEITR